ncbi:MAG: hypothetical protein Q8L55_00755 [Phycisphaerales bacterium]|nr:hypothetical protein [Phycisphaerales bacterium]
MSSHPGLKSLVSSTVRGRTSPLTRTEKLKSQQVALRLRDELRAVIDLLSPPDRGASALAKKLNLDRATCQRIVATIAEPTPDARTLVNFPGIEGLRLFIDAVAKRPKAAQGDRQIIESAANAIDSLESLLDQLKVSQRGLRRLLEDHSVQPVEAAQAENEWLGQDDVAARATLFNAAAHVVGRWTDTLVGVSIIRPVVGSPKLTQSVQLRAHLGHHAHQTSVPLELGSRAQVHDTDKTVYTTLDEEGRSGPWGALVVPYCSRPLPRVTSRRIGGMVTHVVEREESSPDAPFDVVIANRTGTPEPHPATLTPAVGEVSSIVRYPSRRMLHDVFLHRDIARTCIPALETHLWTPTDTRLMARWSTRIPGGPKLQLLGQGLRVASTPAWDRYLDLLRYGFEHAGWNPDEFVGYRCEIEFPLWRCSYHFLFDFTAGDTA